MKPLHPRLSALYDPTQRIGTFQQFSVKHIGPYVLSIQGSGGHYSRPRENMDRLSDYTHVEVAIMDSGGWVDITQDDVLLAFPGYNALLDKWEGKDVDGPADGTYVFSYLGIEHVSDLIYYLEQYYKDEYHENN